MGNAVQLLSVLYANRGASKDKLEEYQNAIDDFTQSIKTDNLYTKAYWRRAASYEKLKDFKHALEDYTKIKEIDPQYQPNHIKDAIARLTPLAKKQEEEEREKMMGDLKDLGNKFLGLFGMSIDNFRAVQDPMSGSYSIAYDQNAGKK